MKSGKEKILMKVGWRERVSLPELGLDAVIAKVDTGARTSCLHAFYVTPFVKNDEKWVRFGIHPHQDDSLTEVICEARIHDERLISDSGGHKEMRYIISTTIILGAHTRPIELSLTNRDTMRFRMLLGRTAMKNIIVYPKKSFLLKQK